MYKIFDKLFEKLQEISERQREWFYNGMERVTEEEIEAAKKILQEWEQKELEKNTLHILQKEIPKEKKEITCCIMGEGEITLKKGWRIKRLIKKEVKNAIKKGYKVFLSRFEEDIDLLVAEAVIAVQKRNCDIILKVYLPYKKDGISDRAKKVLECCQQTWAVEENSTENCYEKRNCFMLEHSMLLIEVVEQKNKANCAEITKCAEKRNMEICEVCF